MIQVPGMFCVFQHTQGDYGLFQSAEGRIKKTYDNETWVMRAMAAQGFITDDSGVFQVPGDRMLSMRIPHDLIPACPDDGGPVSMNLRADETTRSLRLPGLRRCCLPETDQETVHLY